MIARTLSPATVAVALLLGGCASAAPTPASPSPEAEAPRAPESAPSPPAERAPSAATRSETPTSDTPSVPRIGWGLVMHGGAGTITREGMTPALEARYRARMTEAMRAGHAVLAGGGSSLDAVVAAITILEDSPLFNAGKGAVFTADGTNSLDASIMDGATLRAGAVAGVTNVKNPITLARRVMEASPHVLLSGGGAETFAVGQGIEQVDPSYFHTERRWKQLQAAREAEKHGTVGVVALDRSGRIAAGTSTGGMTNKKWGRIGDSPIIGAGTYANGRCGVSSTGWGEYFIRNVVAYDICARAEYKGITLQEAAQEVIMQRLEAQERNTGGIVALDGDGRIVMVFNTPGMYRGYVNEDGVVVTEIYR